MDSRKVQKIGLKTLAVSLPKHWVKTVGLKPGDLIIFNVQPDNSLTLKPSNMIQKGRSELSEIIYSDLCNEPNLLERIILGSYVLGTDVIRIVSSRRIRGGCIETVRGIVHKLIGIGIIQETANEIVLQCSIDPLKFPVNILIRRLYIIVSTMFREAVEALMNFGIDLAKEVIDRENEANTVYWLILRLLTCVQKKRDMMPDIGIESTFQILSSWSITQYLERIGDWAQNIAELVVTLEPHYKFIDKGDLETISEASNKAYEICYLAMQSLYKRDLKLANSVIDEYKKELEKSDVLFSRKNLDIGCALGRIEYAAKRIAELGAEIAEMVIYSSVESPNELCETIEKKPKIKF